MGIVPVCGVGFVVPEKCGKSQGFFAGGGVTTGVSDATGVDGGTPGSSASSAIISFVNALLHLANFLF